MRIAATGVGTALVGIGAFGLVHAVAIAPIWSQLPRGLPFATAAGLAIAWAFDEVHRGRRVPTVAAGLRFGAVLFLTLLPATLYAAARRAVALQPGDILETAIVLTLAAASGAAAGARGGGTTRSIAAFATATVVLTLASGGPLPAAQSAPGFWLAAAFGPICVLAGAVLAGIRSSIQEI